MVSLSLNQYILEKSQCSSIARVTVPQVWRGKIIGLLTYIYIILYPISISGKNNILMGSFHFRKASDFFQYNKVKLN